MKINEKNLVYFALSDSPVDKEGWLLKRGEVNKSFQKRWFVLKGNLLFYFDKKAEKEPVGVIIMEGCTIELAENEDQYTFKVVFHGAGDRTYILGADTQETMESWMKALACASYDYMKVMVAELQRQLDEFTALEKAAALTINVSNTDVPIRPPRKRPLRTNPFNRYHSQEDILTITTSHVKNSTSDDSGTSPIPVRPAPPPPVPQQSSSLVQTEMRGSTDSLPSRRTFHDLHEEYGLKINSYMETWRKQRLPRSMSHQEKLGSN